MTVLLTRRAVVQAEVEAIYNTAASLGSEDGVLCEVPDFSPDPEVLERNFVRDTLSPQAHVTGRIRSQVEFTTELRGNGSANTGLANNAPMLAKLLRGCGYKMLPSADSRLLGPYDIDVHANPVVWATSSGGAATGTLTLNSNPSTTETVTIRNRVYTFKDALSGAANEVLLGASASDTIDNLVAAINRASGEGVVYGTGTPGNDDVSAAAGAGDTMVVTALVRGTEANAFATTETFSDADSVWGAANLSGGTDISTASDVIAYLLEVTTAGASGVAKITVTSDTNGEGNAEAVVTTASAFTVGSKGLTITPTFTGSLAAGQKWQVWLLPPGILMKPRSTDFESLTVAVYKDGVKHLMPGSFGTFEVTAEAGKYGTVKFTYQGSYEDPVDAVMPTPVYERALPPQIELARLRMESFAAIVEKFTFNQANDVQLRPDMNSEQGYLGSRIVDRKPEGGIDPEADLIANYDFWSRLRNSTRMGFQVRAGSEAGNTVWMIAPSVQYTKMTYGDRQGILTYDVGLKFSGYTADDESFFFFC